MLKVKIVQVLPYMSMVKYKLSFGGAVQAEQKGNKLRIGYLDSSNNLRTNEIKINDFSAKHKISEDFFGDFRLDFNRVSLMFANPFVLLDEAPYPRETGIKLMEMFRRIDRTTARSKATLNEMRKIIFLSNFGDEGYYAIALLVKKLKARAIPDGLIPEAIIILKASVLAARAESDIPMLAFLNGYLLSLENFIPLEEIDEMLPGIATQKICDSTKHLLKM